MTIATPVNGFSATVRLELRAGRQVFRLSHLGGGQIILKTPAILPGTTGDVTSFIDEHKQRWTATWEASSNLRKVVPVTLSPQPSDGM